jgi:hypothetical protein
MFIRKEIVYMDKFIILAAITVAVCGGILIHRYYNDKKRE